MGKWFTTTWSAVCEGRFLFRALRLLHFLWLKCLSPWSSQCHSHCGHLRPRVSFLTLLSCIARGRPHAFEFCCAQSLFWVRPSLSAFTFAAVFLSDLASCLVVSGHTSTQTCAQKLPGLHVWWSLHALSCFTHVWHRFFGCRSRPLIVNFPLSALSSLEVLRSVLGFPTLL